MPLLLPLTFSREGFLFMTLTEFLAWLTTSDQYQAYRTWKTAYLRSHPDKAGLPDHILNIRYTMDDQIRDYWRSQIGQLNHQLILFWITVKRPRLKWRWFWFKWRLSASVTRSLTP